MIKCEKIFLSIYKETQRMQRLDYPPLHQDVLPPRITNETKSGHNFFYPRERRQKNVLGRDNRRSFSKRLFER